MFMVNKLKESNIALYFSFETEQSFYPLSMNFWKLNSFNQQDHPHELPAVRRHSPWGEY